jgi:predicted RNA methylase
MNSTTHPTAEKLRAIAARLESEANAKRGPRNENTPKRQRQGMEARHEAGNLDRAAHAAWILAAGWESDSVPKAYQSINTRKELEAMTRRRSFSTGYYHVGTAEEHVDEGSVARAFRQWVAGQSGAEHKKSLAERAAADALRTLENSTKFDNIPGFFPSPPAVCARILEAAGRSLAGLNVLEPSAGIGSLMDAAREAGANVVGFEVSAKLAGICEAKGHVVERCDFLTREIEGEVADAVLMNPPFENRQDAAHVRRAFLWLKPGGVLVAVMSASAGFSGYYDNFREWLASVGGTMENLPENSFKDSHCSTGVRTVIVTIHK